MVGVLVVIGVGAFFLTRDDDGSSLVSGTDPSVIDSDTSGPGRTDPDVTDPDVSEPDDTEPVTAPTVVDGEIPEPTEEPDDLGDDAAFNSLARDCYGGDMQACDTLYGQRSSDPTTRPTATRAPGASRRTPGCTARPPSPASDRAVVGPDAPERASGPAGRLEPRMGILDRILRAGEGKKLKALQGLVPDINALEPGMQQLTDDALQAKTAEFRERLATATTSTTCHRGVRRHPRGRRAASSASATSTSS